MPWVALMLFKAAIHSNCCEALTLGWVKTKKAALGGFGMCSGTSLKRAPRILLEHTTYNTRTCQLAKNEKEKTNMALPLYDHAAGVLQLLEVTSTTSAYISEQQQTPTKWSIKTCVPFQTVWVKNHFYTHSRSRLLAQLLVANMSHSSSDHCRIEEHKRQGKQHNAYILQFVTYPKRKTSWR